MISSIRQIEFKLFFKNSSYVFLKFVIMGSKIHLKCSSYTVRTLVFVVVITAASLFVLLINPNSPKL